MLLVFQLQSKTTRYFFICMMKKEQGNVILLLLIICLVIGLFVFYQMAKNHIKGSDTALDGNKEVKLESILKDSLNNDLSQPLSKPLEPDNTEPAKNQILNPFISVEKNPTSSKTSDLAQAQERIEQASTKKTDNKKSSSEKQTKPTAAVNTITISPNGLNLPSKTTYLPSYPIKNNNGQLKVIIDNKASNTNMLAFLYFKKPYLETKKIDRNELSGVAYIQAGDRFDFSDLDSGYYRMIWVNLHTGKSFKTTEFNIHRDHAYAYDKQFTFTHQNIIRNDKIQEIPTAYIYRSN